MEVVTLIEYTCVSVSRGKISDRWFEQGINFKFFVKLENNETEICALLCEANGGAGMKKVKCLWVT